MGLTFDPYRLLLTTHPFLFSRTVQLENAAHRNNFFMKKIKCIYFFTIRYINSNFIHIYISEQKNQTITLK